MQKTKLLLLAALLFVVGAAKADVATTDKVVLNVYDDQVLTPGGDAIYISVSLESATDVKYTAYQMSFELPEGLEVCMADDSYEVYMYGNGGFYPRTGSDRVGWTYKHTLGSNVVAGNVLNVTCYSSTNALFAKTSGDLFDFYVKATPYLKPGDVEIKVKNVKFVTPDETKYLPEDYVSTAVQATTTSTLTLKVSASNKFGTCILPFDYALPADGSLEAYTCGEYTDDALVLEKASKIAAYTPYILYSEAGFSQTISGTVDATNYPADGIVKSGHLVGTVVQTELTEATSYVMQNQGQGPKFYQVDPASPFVLSAGKCYVELPAGTSATSLRIGGRTTCVELIHNSEFRILNCIYNLFGQRVEKMLPGQVYIVNGRKVVNK